MTKGKKGKGKRPTCRIGKGQGAAKNLQPIPIAKVSQWLRLEK